MSIKYQAFTYDFFLAVAIFIFSLLVLISLWKNRIERFEEYDRIRRMHNLLIDASEIWFIEGYPTHWDLENLSELGLANNGKINFTKMLLLNNISYYKFLDLVKSYNFYVKYEVYDTKGKIIFEYPKIKSEGKNILFLDRYAILNDSVVKVRTIVWKWKV